MASVEGRIQAVRTQLMHDAARRWHDRQAVRDTGLRQVEERGPGAADSPQQVARYINREQMKAAFGRLRAQERILGSNDLVAAAPSSRAVQAALPVARITTEARAGVQPMGFGTGLLLPGGLLLTNYHVFPGRGHARDCAANFGHVTEDGNLLAGAYFPTDPDRFFTSDPTLDYAIVAVKATSTDGRPLADIPGTLLIEAVGKILTGMPVNIIQHPGGGPRKFAVSNNRLVDLLPSGFLHYEADTEPGSSGSPVFNRDWELLALHHSGVPELRDGKVLSAVHDGPYDPRDESDAVKWVANEGTRVSAIVNRLRQARMASEAEQVLLAQLLGTTQDPLEQAAQQARLSEGVRSVTGVIAGITPSSPSAPAAPAVLPTAPAPSGPGAFAGAVPGLPAGVATSVGNLLWLVGPTTVHVQAPPPATVPPAVAPAAPGPARPAMDALEKSLVFDPDYPRRPGYQPGFLGTRVPLPTVVAARRAELYTVADYRAHHAADRTAPTLDLADQDGAQPLELTYHHYSLVLNKRFRMAMFTASNVDHGDAQREDRRGRAEFGGETWRFDPRVPRALQLGNDDIYGPAKRVDRGHIVRREDNGWGAAGRATEFANSDTYHWTNCAPQHEAFNQDNPSDKSGRSIYQGTGLRGLWGQFEGALAQQIEAGGDQAILFAGPVLADFIAHLRWGRDPVPVPAKFWKVVVVPASRARKPKLLTCGYLFDQSDVVRRYGLDYTKEALDLPAFARHRVGLADLTRLTGVAFPRVVMGGEQPL